MKHVRMRRSGRIALVALVAAACATAGTDDTAIEPVSPAAEVVSAKDYDASAFGDGATVDNTWFPLVPGTRMTWEGTAFDKGEKIRRRVVFTVSDMTKTIDGVTTVVGLDLDYSDDELGEQEIMFFAQDDGGNVWLFGEYPEEYEDGEIGKTPAWIHGFEGARAGLAMKAEPAMGDADYAQGWGPKIGWNDRASVYATPGKTRVRRWTATATCWSCGSSASTFRVPRSSSTTPPAWAPSGSGGRARTRRSRRRWCSCRSSASPARRWTNSARR